MKLENLLKKSCIISFFGVSLIQLQILSAASASWTTDGDGNWNNNSNWSAAFPNAATEVATYDLALTNSITVTLGQDITVGTIAFGSTLDQNVSVGAANTITFDNGGSSAAITVAGSTANTISSAISLSDDLTVTHNSSGALTLSGGVAGTSKGLTKAGTGNLALNGTNSYTGATTVSAGTLTLGGTINSTSGVTVSSGATLAIIGGTLPNLSGAGTVTNGGATTSLSGSSSTNFSGVISGTGGLDKTNTATTTLSGINTYTGLTQVSFGTLVFSGSGSVATSSEFILPSGQGSAVNVNTNTTFPNLTGSITGGAVATITVGSGFILTLNNSSDTSYGSVIAGAGGITKTGAGKLTLADTTVGDVNTYTGVTTISAGTLTVAGSIATTASVTNNATLEFDTATGSRVFAKVISGTGALIKSNSNSITLSAANTYTGATTINGGSIIQGIESAIPSTTAVTLADTSGVALTLGSFATTIGSLAGGGSNGGNVSLGSATLTVGDSTSTSYAGVISGTGGLTKQGSGVLTLTGTNTYTGTTTINAGTLRLSGTSIIPTAAVVTLANTAGVILDLNDNSTTLGSISGGGGTGGNITLGSGTLTVGNSLDQTYGGVISETGGLTKQNSGTLTLSGTNTYTGTTTISAGTLKVTGSILTTSAVSNSGTLEIDTTSGNVTFEKVISGTGGVTKSGSNTLSLETVDHTYTGTTVIGGGTLSLTRTNQLSSSSPISFTADNTTLDLNSNTQTFASISGSGSGISVDIGSITMTVGDSSDFSFNGVITGTGSIIKTGSGTWTISGTHTYTGNTTVSAGTLKLSAGTINNSDVVTVSSGATLEYDTTDGNLELSKALEGAGALVKSGTGTLTVSADTSLTGPASISGGTLALSSGTAILNVSSTTMSGSSTVNIPDSITGSLPVLSGVGTININSTGKVSFQTAKGSSSFTGTVTGGTGVSSTMSALGNVGNRFTLIGDQSGFGGVLRAGENTIFRVRGSFENAVLMTTGADTTSIIEVDTTNESLSFSKSGVTLTGAGLVKVLGGNTFSLTAESTQTFSGGFEAENGTLALNGVFSSSGTTTIDSDGRLKGVCTVNDVVNSGTVQPGNSIGTITILGDYTQNADSTLEIEIDAFGNTSLLDVTGTATISTDNTTLLINPQGGTRYSETRTYVFIDADGGIVGSFGNPSTLANSNLNGVSFSVAISGNQYIITVFGNNNPDDLAKAILSSTSNLALRINQVQQGMITEIQNQRLMETFYCPTNCTEQEVPYSHHYKFLQEKKEQANKKACIDKKLAQFYHPYVLFDYAKDQMVTLDNQTNTKDWYRSVGAGCDFYLLRQLVLGASFAYTGATARVQNSRSYVESDTYNLGTYFQSEFYEDFYLDGSIQGAKSYYDRYRNDADEGIKKGKFHGYEVASQLRLLMQKAISILRIRPFMGLNYFLQQTGNFKERRDGNNILFVGKDHFIHFEWELGLNLWVPLWLGRNSNWNLVPHFSSSFVQTLKHNNHDISIAYITDPEDLTFVPIGKTSRTYWVIDTGISTYFGQCSEGFFTYKGIFDKRYSTNQEYRIGFRIAF